MIGPPSELDKREGLVRYKVTTFGRKWDLDRGVVDPSRSMYESSPSRMRMLLSRSPWAKLHGSFPEMCLDIFLLVDSKGHGRISITWRFCIFFSVNCWTGSFSLKILPWEPQVDVGAHQSPLRNIMSGLQG